MPSSLTTLETEVIDFFVQISRVLGQAPSLGEIYGLLFIAARPLSLDDVVERLSMSRGSASQGLRFLQSAGAVRTVYVPGERKAHYEAVAQLRYLATRFLRDQVVPHLDSGLDRLDRISTLVAALPAEHRARVGNRLTMLRSWEKKSRRILPIIVKILGG
jgi:DNA-binding transcriptional regulator GbsR (MarR family)